jgi:hypothetical protein
VVRASDLDIPTSRLGEPAWRPREKRGRPRVLMLAGVVGVFALLAALALVGTGEQSEREVPLIVADTAPFRVRPADPGGMQVANQDQLVYQRMAGSVSSPSGRRIEVLLPAPEEPLPVPRPAPLAAPALAPEVAASAEMSAAPAPADPQPAPKLAAGLPLPPPSPSVAAQPAAPAAPASAPAPARADGPVQVQLAAVGAEAAVQPEWNRLRARMPDLLGNRELLISRGERDGQPFWRVRTGGFADVAAARAFCDQVRARGFTCFVVGGP